MIPFSPERRGAHRLGMLVFGGALLGVTLVCLPIPGDGVVRMSIALLVGIGISLLYPTLYRWVTAPERETGGPS